MRRPAVITLVASGVLAALLIAGCTSSGGGAASGRSAYSDSIAVGVPGVATPEPAASAAANGSAGGGATSGGNSATDATPSGATSAKLVADTGAVIRTAQITVGVKDAAEVALQANKAEALVAARGGEVFGDDRNDGTGGDTPDRPLPATDATATLTLKVPPAQLTATLTALSQLGSEQSRSLSSQDVTTQVADVNARLTSAAASIARLRTLYASATSVSNVIAIESELSQREADLESLQAQQRALSSETAMATVTLVLTTVTPPATPHHHHYSGIGGAFANGWHHFGSAGAWLLTALATVLPFAVVLALLIAAGLWIRRRRAAPVAAPVAE